MKNGGREYSRVEVSWPVTILSSEGLIDAEVKNISLDGALIRCRQLPSSGKLLDLSIMIPEHHYSMLASAEIVRSHVYKKPRYSPSFDLGVRFKEISDDDLRFLSNTVLF